MGADSFYDSPQPLVFYIERFMTVSPQKMPDVVVDLTKIEGCDCATAPPGPNASGTQTGWLFVIALKKENEGWLYDDAPAPKIIRSNRSGPKQNSACPFSSKHAMPWWLWCNAPVIPKRVPYTELITSALCPTTYAI